MLSDNVIIALIVAGTILLMYFIKTNRDKNAKLTMKGLEYEKDKPKPKTVETGAVNNSNLVVGDNNKVGNG